MMTWAAMTQRLAAEKKPEEEEAGDAGDAGVQGEGENPDGNMSIACPAFSAQRSPRTSVP